MEEKSISQMKSELRDFYFKKIKPNLETINRTRRISRIDAIGVFCILGGFAWCMVFGILKIEGAEHLPLAGFILIIFGVFISLFTKYKKGGSTVADITGEDEVKRKYMPEFLKIFGTDMKWSKDNVYKAAEDLNIYKTLNIMNPFIILTFDDTICGNYKGVNFNILEVNTAITSLSNLLVCFVLLPFVFGCGCGIFAVGMFFVFPLAIWLGNLFENVWVTIGILLFYVGFIPLFGLFKLLTTHAFRGVLVEFDMNKNFEGHTFVHERANTSRGIKFNRSKFEEVKLEDPEFMQKYVVYSDNQVEARYVLTTAFIERFLKMKVAFKAKYIRAAFKDGKITIAINAGRDLFQMANLEKDTDSNTFTELFDEILSVLELINALKLNQKIGL